MELKLINLYESKDFKKIKLIGDKITEDEITCMIDNMITSKSHDLPKLLSSIFIGFSGVASLKQHKERMVVFTKMLDIVTFQNIPSQLLLDVINVLISEMDMLGGEGCVDLLEDLLLVISNPHATSYKALDLLPKLFSVLQGQNVMLKGVVISGNEYKHNSIATICSLEWCPQSLLSMASSIRELQLSAEELSRMLATLLKYLSKADVQDIPSITYQLLLIASKGCRSQIVVGIVDMFCNKEAELKASNNITEEDNHIQSSSSSLPSSSSPLEQVESTCLYHMCTAVKHNHELGREIIKYLKICQLASNNLITCQFQISLALSLVKINLFQKQVLDILKDCVVGVVKGGARREESRWLEQMNTVDVTDAADCFMVAVRKSLRSWDVVMEGLITLSFHFLEANKSPGKASMNPSTNKNCRLTSTLTSLAADILEECAKVHVNVGLEIVKQLINKVVAKQTNVKHITDVLHTVIRTSGHFTNKKSHKNSNNTTIFRNTFDYFHHLPCNTSKLLLSSILPIVRTHPSVKNSLIIVLRKAMFSRHSETKKMGIEGFLMLLGNTKVLAGILPSTQSQRLYSSQVMVDVHNNNNANNNTDNTSLCLEVLTVLKRCLTSDADVKKILYRGLVEVSHKNEQLITPIIDLLYNQFLLYYSGDGAMQPPLKLKECVVEVDGGYLLQEPLADLLNCLMKLTQQYNENNKDDDENNDTANIAKNNTANNNTTTCSNNNNTTTNNNTTSKINTTSTSNIEEMVQDMDKIVDSVASRFINMDVEDLEFDKESGWEMECRNNKLLKLTTTTLTILIQREFMKMQLMDIERSMKLFKCLQSLLEHAILNQVNKKNKKHNHLDINSVDNFYSFNFLSCVTKSLLSNNSNNNTSNNEDNNIASIIATNATFMPYIFNNTITTLQQHATCCNGVEVSATFDHVYHLYEDLAKTCLDFYMQSVKPIKPTSNNNNNTNDNDETTTSNNNNKLIKTKQFNNYCIRILHQIFIIITTHSPNKLPTFISNLEQLSRRKKMMTSCKEDILNHHVALFQKIFLTAILSGEDRNISVKDQPTILSIYSLLVSKTQYISSRDNRQSVSKNCYDWLMKLFKEHVIDDLETHKHVTRLTLTYLKAHDPSLAPLKLLARDVHLCLGDIDQEKDLEGEKEYRMISTRSSSATLQLLLGHIEVEITDADFLIAQLRNHSHSTAYHHSSPKYSKDPVSLPATHFSTTTTMSLLSRFSTLASVLSDILQTYIPYGPCIDALVKCLNRFYLGLTNLLKLYIHSYSNKHLELDYCVRGVFEKMIRGVASKVNLNVYPIITHVETIENEVMQAANDKQNKKKKDGGVEKLMRMSKKTQSLPTLVFNIEVFEKFLILLSKKAKVNLMAHFKLTTSRDFRINNSVLTAAIQREQQQDDDEEEDDDGGDGDGVNREGGREDDDGVVNENDDDDNDDGSGDGDERARKRARKDSG